MRWYVFSVLLLLRTGLCTSTHAQQVTGPKAYSAQIKTYPEKQLVEIIKVSPRIKLDIRYATVNNFMGRKMYAQARAFARKPVAEALEQVQIKLEKRGLGLKIYDAYRPYAVTVAFFKLAKDTNFVANPKLGSKHNRGCAIDLTLVDLKTGKELSMPTPYDSFSRKAAANHTAGISPEQIRNREILKSVMHAHGFTVLKTEWWHYDFNGWRNYELLDVPFQKL